ncbi:MAG: hypothetical protein ACI35O_09040 [Bacillaceae bacterium]
MSLLTRFIFHLYLLLVIVGFTIYYTVVYKDFGTLDPIGFAFVTCNVCLSLITYSKMRDMINEA